MTDISFEGATVFLPNDIVETSVRIAEGQIVEIGGATSGAQVVDGRGLFLAPALIDVHGDAFERQLMPRPGVFFPFDVALLETDRQLAANGIATTYHALTLGWEPGLRSVERGRALINALDRLAPRLTVENRLQLRWETFAFEALDTIEKALKMPLTPALAFNDHTSMGMRHFETSIQKRAFEQSPDFILADFDDPRMRERHIRHAERSDMPLDDYMMLLSNVWNRRPEVDAMIRALASKARAVGAPMLSHDDTQVEARAYYRMIGATVAEFPMTMAPARDARDHDDQIVFGSPNIVRGGSHIGSLSAADMVEDRLCDVLASDYYYPAMLAAVARLDSERRADRSALWSLVSAGPARAMKLEDRGEIAVGKRADLVLMDWPIGATPAIRATYSAGRCAYAARPFDTGNFE